MDSVQLEQTGTGACRIAGVLSLATVPGLGDEGVEWLRLAPDHCVIDLAEARFEGSAGVALLVAWLRAANEAGKRLEYRNPPTRLQRIATVTGTGGILGFGEQPAADESGDEGRAP